MRLENSYTRLPAALLADIVPQPAPEPQLIAWNAPLAESLGVSQIGKDAQDRARLFSGGPLPVEFRPVALAYAGHQFGSFVPQLGDGRAALIAEVVDAAGVRRDIQLKGSGRTPFSRGGDGRSWLGPVIREYLVSEAMHHLGVPTTRALAAATTGEAVYRDGALPGAVMTRVAASHLRVGTFEFLAARDDADGLRALADYAIERHYPDALEADDPYTAFFDAVVSRQAALVAHWMALGFIHGVMNTDNTSIAGETIDYGPCAFMDEFRFNKVFSSIDRFGRYAYAEQPPIAQWNLARLAECLLLVTDARSELEAALSAFPERYEQTWRLRMRAKLGLEADRDGDDTLIVDWLRYLEENGLDYTQSFRELAASIADEEPARFGDPGQRWRERVRSEGRPAAQIVSAMNAVNPKYIPRNHRVEQAIEAAVEGDLGPFDDLATLLQRPFEAQPEFEHYAEPPAPEERVTRTFCGT